MRQLTNYFTLVLLITLIYSCQDGKTKTKTVDVTDVTVDKDKPATKNISKDTFDAWKSRWNDTYRGYIAKDSMHYFDMPLSDLGEVLVETSVDNARFYLGMDKDTIPHLMLVGTTKGVPNYGVIADYTTSCPPACSGGNN